MIQKTILNLAAAVALAIPGISMAAPGPNDVSGPVEYTYTGIYAGTSSSLTYDIDGAPYSTDEVLLICIDHSTQPPFTYNVDTAQFETKAGASAIKGGSGAAGEAAIYWLLDQYYESHYKPGSTIEQRRALQYALWEIGNDYDGTAASINVAAGSSRPQDEDVTDYGGTDQAAFVSAYTALYEAMRTTLPTLPTTYRSSTYTMDLFKNRDPAYQHMVALIEQTPPPNTVPLAEPTITGTPLVGSPVTGSYTYADDHADPEDTTTNGTTYQFVISPNPSLADSSEGTVVASGTTGGEGQTVSYTVQPSDLNQYLYFCVTPAAQSGPTPGQEVCSAASARVANAAATPVPSLGQWALLALIALIALLGAGRFRKESA